SSNTVHKGSLETVLGKAEKQMIIDAMIAHRGNMTKAAKQLGITERVVALRIKKFNINSANYKNLSSDS
ncbi:MAG: helix-turn-helix domain-containing protein, partial [Tannerella sp.]|nr:helix-turn-helix domain-containing protein [Tannerella sp.]